MTHLFFFCRVYIGGQKCEVRKDTVEDSPDLDDELYVLSCYSIHMLYLVQFSFNNHNPFRLLLPDLHSFNWQGERK